ncbi:hypothetical protein QYS36_06640 [Pseudomonas sp. G34]|uniref:hypothetical protein n=1 Tax=Pseudomonas sp. G34 TaxID=3059083 RepID=UPI0028098835|nr:hypothetical protein [Pseudomonas sp. G34]MDQ7984612.1 hypothetical protein [Pseudomonas sp. G34]
MNILQKESPADIQAKFDAINKDIVRIIEKGHAELTTIISGNISFRYVISAPLDVLTDFERAQSFCFVTKYESLPTVDSVNIAEHKGRYFPNNIDDIKHVLNEYRPIIQNQGDSVHYQNIHAWCHKKLGADPTRYLSITVQHENGKDITTEFRASLAERVRAVRKILAECEFGYIYNGILQHSDHQYTERLWKEYINGELNYVLIKHATILGEIKDLLNWHYRLFNTLTFPKMGSL